MSSKQAELRRLMKLQRDKKRHEPPPPPKRVAPAPKSILKKSNKVPKATADPTNNGSLSALVAGYSSSDSEEEERKPIKPDQQQPRARFAPDMEEPKAKQNTVVGFEEKTKSALKVASIRKQRAQENDIANGSAKTINTADEKEEMVDPETWKEFQDLVGDDKDETPVPAKTETQQPSFIQQQAPPPIPPSSTTDSAPGAQKVNETAAASIEETTPEQATAPDTTQVEQVAYEARLARLRLKMAAAKKRKRASMENDTTASSYTPDLAFQKESSNQVSHLDILREKRAKARKLHDMEVDDNT